MSPIEQSPPPVPYGVLGSTEQVVAGTIDLASGASGSGPGFTWSRPSTGRADITYTTPFSASPTILLSGGINTIIVTLWPPTTRNASGFGVQVTTPYSAGAAGNYAFDFVAYIPSPAKTRLPRDFGLVTVLPTSPTPQTGDLCTFTDSLTAPTYVWRLMYDGSQVAANKWLCIGGSPARNYITTMETTTSTTATNLTTVGPDVIVPLAGDYDVAWGAGRLDSGAGAPLLVIEVWNANTARISAASPIVGTQVTTSGADNIAIEERLAAVAASTTLRLRYYVTGGTGRFSYRWLRVMPVRVG